MEVLICKGLFFPNPQNMGQMHISNDLWSVMQDCLYPGNSYFWKIKQERLVMKFCEKNILSPLINWEMVIVLIWVDNEQKHPPTFMLPYFMI